MTTTADEPTTATTVADVAVPAPRAGVGLTHEGSVSLVAVHGSPDRRTASVLSCRLHEAVATATTTVVVDLGAASAADPAIERVLVCARASAADRGLAFVLR